MTKRYHNLFLNFTHCPQLQLQCVCSNLLQTWTLLLSVGSLYTSRYWVCTKLTSLLFLLQILKIWQQEYSVQMTEEINSVYKHIIYSVHLDWIKLLIHDTNKCIFHSIKYNLISLLYVLPSLMPSSRGSTPRF